MDVRNVRTNWLGRQISADVPERQSAIIPWRSNSLTVVLRLQYALNQRTGVYFEDTIGQHRFLSLTGSAALGLHDAVSFSSKRFRWNIRQLGITILPALEAGFNDVDDYTDCMEDYEDGEVVDPETDDLDPITLRAIQHAVGVIPKHRRLSRRRN